MSAKWSLSDLLMKYSSIIRFNFQLHWNFSGNHAKLVIQFEEKVEL